MANTKISAATDAGTLVGTDRVPLARSGSTTAYSTSLTALQGYVAIAPYTSVPYMDGAGAAGGSALYSRGDHIHPSDTSKLSLSGGVMTGPLTLSADGTAALHAVTKQQLDALTTAAGYAPLANPVFTGNPQAPTPTAGDNDTSLATTQFVQSAIAPYANDAGRNLLHNGRFEVQQRGVGPWTASTNFLADRWRLFLGNDTTTVTIGLTPLGGYGFDEAQRCYLGVNVTGSSSGGSYTLIQQSIEGVARTANKTVTVSFYCGLASGTANIGVDLVQNFGSGGSPSASVTVALQSVVVNTVWTRYSMTFSVPSVAGKTLGTAGDDSLTLRLWFSNPASAVGRQTANFGLWGVQLEVGSVATPLARRDPADEMQLCQRFYQTGQIYAGGYSAGNVSAIASWVFPVAMRAQPQITVTTNADTNLTSPTTVYFGGASAAFVGATPAGAVGWSINRVFTASADL